MTIYNIALMAPRVPRYNDFRPASETTSRIKQRNKAKDTKAEVLLREEVWRRGLRYRVHKRGLPGRPDLVFGREKVAVFCDGDFWHGRNWKSRRKKLARGSNSAYWIPKIQANIVRDRAQTKALREAGWKVIRLWETDVLRDPEIAAEKVEDAVVKARGEHGESGHGDNL